MYNIHGLRSYHSLLKALSKRKAKKLALLRSYSNILGRRRKRCRGGDLDFEKVFPAHTTRVSFELWLFIKRWSSRTEVFVHLWTTYEVRRVQIVSLNRQHFQLKAVPKKSLPMSASFFSGSTRVGNWQWHGASAQRKVGHLGSHAHLRRPFRRSQHLLQLETRLHLQRESLFRPLTSLPLQNGYGYSQVHLALLLGALRFLLR